MTKEKVVGLGLVGLGGFSGVIGGGAHRSQKAKVVTCFDIVPEKRMEASKKYGCDQEKSYEDVLKRKEVDGVLLVSPNAVHCEQAVLAAQHGKHVFVEKPIANRLEDGKKMIEACKKAGVVLMVGHYRRRNVGNRKIKELIDKGAIGKPIMVEANVSNRLGFELTPDKFRWRGDDSGCPAGALMTMGIHHVDVFNYLFGPIETVFSFFNKLYIPPPVEDVTASVCKFKSGIVGYIGANYASPKANWMYIYGTEANLLWSTYFPDLPADQYFKAVANSDQFTRLVMFEKGKDQQQEVPLVPRDPYLEEINEFVHCIQTGDKPETDGEGALIDLAFVRAAIESARTGQPVKMKDMLR